MTISGEQGPRTRWPWPGTPGNGASMRRTAGPHQPRDAHRVLRQQLTAELVETQN